jgi:HPt (histidine-containing phosphotransfer) domain-containing protein
MAQAAIKTEERAAAIDREQLARMTFGDCGLERELLKLFDRQTMLLLGRMRDADAGSVATLAHTLKGSASGVGAWSVARAAANCEWAASGNGSLAELSLALDELDTELAVARAEIARMLGATA